MTNNIIIKEINIKTEKAFEGCISMRHSFVLHRKNADGEFRFCFDMPRSAAISGFELICGERSASSRIIRADKDVPIGISAELRCIGDGIDTTGHALYELYIPKDLISAADITLCVRSAAICKYEESEYAFYIPILADDRLKAERADNSVPVTITAYSYESSDNLYSPRSQYKIESLAGSNTPILVSHCSVGDVFELRIGAKTDTPHRSKGFVCLNLNSKAGIGWYCFYQLFPKITQADTGNKRPKNLKLKEYCPGVYFMVPDIIHEYSPGDPIFAAMGSEGAIPHSFELISDEYEYKENIIVTDTVRLDTDNGIEESFGRLALDRIYELIRSGMSDRSVLRLKKTAARLSEDLNILSPESRCILDCKNDPENSVPVLFSPSSDRNRLAEHNNNNNILRDSSGKDFSSENVRQIINELLCNVRIGGEIADPYEYSVSAVTEQTAYARKALGAAADLGLIDAELCGDIKEILSRADEFIKSHTKDGTSYAAESDNNTNNNADKTGIPSVGGVKGLALRLLDLCGIRM